MCLQLVVHVSRLSRSVGTYLVQDIAWSCAVRHCWVVCRSVVPLGASRKRIGLGAAGCGLGGGGGPLGGRTACRSRAFVFLEGRYWLFALEGLMPHSWAQRLSASSRIRLSEAAWVVPERWLVLVLRWSAHALVCGCVCWQLRSGCLSVACGAGGACLRSSGPERRMIRSSRVCPLHVLMSCPARSRSESPKQRRFLMHRPQIAASLSLSASLHIVYSLAQAPMAA